MLFIYAPAIFVGIIGSRYMSRLANFCLMVAVFQLDLVILVSVLSGELRLRLLVPYTVVAIIPAMAGIMGGKYWGNAANTSLVIAVSYVATMLLAFYGTGQFRLLPSPGAIFVSRGDLVPPLVFILVAILAYRLRPLPLNRVL
jgi:hypothetical protein